MRAQVRRVLVPTAVITVATSIAAALCPLAGEYWVSVGSDIATWIALTESWILLSGLTGYISLGSATFIGTGAYVFILLWGKVPIWLGLMAAGGSAGLVALVVGTPCLRVRGPYFVILTLGVAEFVKYIVVNIEASLANFGRLALGGPDVYTIFYLMSGFAALAYLLAHLVRRSRFGLGLRSIREDESAAETSGVPVTALKEAAFAISCRHTRRNRGTICVACQRLFRALAIIQSSAVGHHCHDGGDRRQRRCAGAALRCRSAGPAIGTTLGQRSRGLYGDPRGSFGRFCPWRARRCLRAVAGPVAVEVAVSLLRLDGVTRRFGGVQALSGVSFSVEAGEILGLMGANGAGKTTLFNLISGTMRPNTGSIEFDGDPIERLRPDQIARRGIARTYQIRRARSQA